MQKSIDRAGERKSEAAAVYRDFFAITSDYFENIKRAWREKDMLHADQHYQDLVQTLDTLMLYAPHDVMIACKEYAESLFAYFYAVRFEVAGKQFPRSIKKIHSARAFRQASECRKAALVQARVNLLNCDESEARSVVYEDPGQPEGKEDE